MFVLKVLLAIVLCLWITFLWRRRKYYLLSMKIQTLHGLPFLGALYKFPSVKDILRQLGEFTSKYDSPGLTWIGTLPVLFVWDPKTAEIILTSPHCVNKAIYYDTFRDGFGDGFITLANPLWELHRKLLNPAFSHEILRSFVPIFNNETKNFITQWDTSYRGELLNILPIMQKLSWNIALQTTMGQTPNRIDKNLSSEKSGGIFSQYHYIMEKIMIMCTMPWLRYESVRNLVPSFKMYAEKKRKIKHNIDKVSMHAIIFMSYNSDIKSASHLVQHAKNHFHSQLIHERLEVVNRSTDENNSVSEKTYDIRKNKNNIFINIAIESLRTGDLTAEQVLDHSNTMLLAAFETTATTLTHILILLAMYPQYQELVFEEIYALFPDRDSVTVGYEHLKELIYMEMVINEAMRVIPTVPFAARTVDEDVEISDGVVLPKGVNVLISIFDMHRHESIWGPNALVFNPDNFLPENIKQKHPYAFIPFTKGIRNCIGWRYGMNSIKISLTILLRKYRFSTTGKFEDLNYSSEVSTILVNPPLLKLHVREK